MIDVTTAVRNNWFYKEKSSANFEKVYQLTKLLCFMNY